MSELKPCPFCGTTVVSIEIYGLYRWVECGNASCLASVKPRSFLVDAGNANHIVATDWNSRPIEDALRAENERLEQRVRKLEEMQRWIPVSERLPEVDTRVEIFGGFEQTTHIGYYREHATQWDSEDGCYWHGKNFGLITHWRPLPEPPEVE